MLERMLIRLSHEPIPVIVATPEYLTRADALLVEPSAPMGAVLAQAASIVNPSLPLICASVTSPPPELSELGIEFTATLIKPFTSEQLSDAIEHALRARHGRRRHDLNNGDRAA
jgi:hypothetical protein